MDPIEILGSLLGGGSKSSQGGGGLGGKILKDLMGGGSRSQPRQSPPSARRPRDLDSQARQLEDLLGVAKDRHQHRSQAGSTRPAPAPQHQPPPSGRTQPRGGGFSFDDSDPIGRREAPDQNEEAVVLIRAMVNAAKSDGRITQDEQQAILERLQNPSQDAIAFLRQEFASPLDVREFAWSVPLGLEEKVYTMSLAAIDLDANQEATYLRELAHGLRLEPEYCNQIHQRFGAPTLY